ncbi:MAG TPA: HEAT repeat domain-containing protein [Pyrinomonadaceae bacterium]|nr:HEAT repeat domain-containing protein [Pyrinomonadaceae bacterium]
MMKTKNPSPHCARLSLTLLRYGTVLALSAMLVAAQSRIIRPPTQSNAAGPSKRPHVATLRASDSPDGSRVSLSSDQSLNNYEAYRRGDRFYVRIPAADVPRAEATRGRGFADVKAQRSGDSTVVSFRLQPGATAHVEQHSNRLEVVFTMPGGNTSTNAGRDTTRRQSNPDSAVNRKANANKPSSSNSSSALRNANTSANRNANRAATRGPVPSNNNTASKSASLIAPSTNAGSKPGATPVATPKPDPSTKPITTTAQKTASATPASQPTPAPQVQTRGTFLGRMKERVNYWILLAQLNPIPVAIGAGVLLLIIALLILQRRRARETRRARPSRTESRKTKPGVDGATSVQSTASKPESSLPASVPATAAAAAPAVVAASSKEERAEPKAPKPPATAVPDSADVARRQRIARVAEEIKNVMAGGDYDESVIGSDDRDTRQLVGAELLAALVGRNVPRRQRARAAFMKHGYFDDATHDLRTAESPNERAAAARRLSFVHESEATPHLIGALDDPSPDVRRAAVEALMDLRDPAAIGPLNSLMQTENDRKVPRTLIKHAIDACATSTPAEYSTPPSSPVASQKLPEPSSLPVDSEREVIEL